jgi:hypothetical protein
MATSVESARDARDRWLDTAKSSSPFQPKGDSRWPPAPTPTTPDLYRATPETYAAREAYTPRDTPYRPPLQSPPLSTGYSYRPDRWVRTVRPGGHAVLCPLFRAAAPRQRRRLRRQQALRDGGQLVADGRAAPVPRVPSRRSAGRGFQQRGIQRLGGPAASLLPAGLGVQLGALRPGHGDAPCWLSRRTRRTRRTRPSTRGPSARTACHIRSGLHAVCMSSHGATPATNRPRNTSCRRAAPGPPRPPAEHALTAVVCSESLHALNSLWAQQEKFLAMQHRP